MIQFAALSRPPRWLWVTGVVLATLLVAGGLFWRAEKKEAAGPPGAYAIPLDENSRVGGGWLSDALAEPRVFAVGQTLRVPDGSRVRIVYADGRGEDVRGPVSVTLEAPVMRGEAIENILAVPLAELASLTADTTNVLAGDVRIFSPVGVTRFTNPVLVWAARPETNYDVAIVDPADPMAPPRVAQKVRPPVAFTELKSPQKRGLQADRLYEVYAREAGSDRVVGAARILVAKDADEGALPAAPADLVREAVEAMAKRPTRTGDAWLALSRLPAAWSGSELVVRLRLRVAAELGQADEFARAQDAARQLVKSR